MILATHVTGGLMTDTPSLTQLRDVMPFATLIGIELLEAGGAMEWALERCTAGGLLHGAELARDDGSLAAKVTQTQAFHYPRS
jgi:1,4-dihydroxy-2-naphthoyl-CoA hydrolase